MKYESTKEEVFDSIYRSYSDEIYRVVRFVVNDWELAYDMTHQAFLNFYKRMDEVEIKPECYKHYIMNAAVNLAKNHLRSVRRETSMELAIAEDKLSHPAFIEESIEETYLKEHHKEMQEKLSEQILEDLKASHAMWYDVIYKMFFEEKDHDVIAEELGITKEVLYSRLYRAKEWIRKHYKTEFDNIEK